MEIQGAGLNQGAIVTFDGVRTAVTGWSPGGSSLAVLTSVHPAGTVNVVVTNPDGQSAALTGAFTYGIAAPLIIETLSSPLGSTAGGTFCYLRGTGLQPGLRVTLDGTDARVLFATATWASLITRAHAAGAVDVLVINADGQVARLERGYTYLPPQSADFNGVWQGQAGDEAETPLEFTVENDRLVSVSCAGRALALSFLPSASGGEFSIPGNRGAGMTAGLLTPDSAEGTINIAQCTYDTGWSAKRR